MPNLNNGYSKVFTKLFYHETSSSLKAEIRREDTYLTYSFVWIAWDRENPSYIFITNEKFKQKLEFSDRNSKTFMKIIISRKKNYSEFYSAILKYSNDILFDTYHAQHWKKKLKLTYFELLFLSEKVLRRFLYFISKLEKRFYSWQAF